MATTYTATFSNGDTITRTSASRAYTFAWRIVGTYTRSGRWVDGVYDDAPYTADASESGFGGSEALARRACDTAFSRLSGCRDAVLTLAEVVPAVVTHVSKPRAPKADFVPACIRRAQRLTAERDAQRAAQAAAAPVTDDISQMPRGPRISS